MMTAIYARKSAEQLGTEDEQKSVARQIEVAAVRHEGPSVRRAELERAAMERPTP
jgi:hypothetical protein